MMPLLRAPFTPIYVLSAALLLGACKEESRASSDTTSTETSKSEAETSEKPTEEEKAPEAKEEVASETTPSPSPSSATGLEKLTFDVGNVDPSWPATEKGWRLIDGLHWKDAKGENLLLSVTNRIDTSIHMETEEIATRHWRKEGETWKEIRKLRERVDSCDVDILMRIDMDPAWSLTDLDEDGLAEVTFTTTSACSGGLDPSNHKILLIEDGEKFALRGENEVEYDKGHYLGGEYKEREDFTSAPEPFQKHIKKIWKDTALIKR